MSATGPDRPRHVVRGRTCLSASTAQLSRTFGALKDRNFRLLWPASILASASRFMEATLLAWLVLEMTDSPWQVALVGFFGWAHCYFWD